MFDGAVVVWTPGEVIAVVLMILMIIGFAVAWVVDTVTGFWQRWRR